MSKKVGIRKAQEGATAKYPVVIIPGFASSGLVVEAGYEKWLGKRVWISILRLMRETVRLKSASAVMVDPTKSLFTNGYYWLREGRLFRRRWNKYYFALIDDKILVWYTNETHFVARETTEIKERIAPIGSTIIDKRSKAFLEPCAPSHASLQSIKTIVRLQTSSADLRLSSETPEATSTLFADISKVLLHLYPKRHKHVKIEPAKQSNIDNMWLKHMALESDGISDPPNIRVRPAKGINAVNYLETGSLVKDMSYVFGYVIDNLLEIGYTHEGDNPNLIALPYDWRLPPFYLQQRDQYFTKMKEEIEQLYQMHKLPVVLLAHSMGNKVTHYFLAMIAAEEGGRDWINSRIYSFFAAGAPWLGAPKSLRATVTGDKMGLDAFLTDAEALALGRATGSASWLFPFCKNLITNDNNISWAMEANNDGTKSSYKALNLEEVLQQSRNDSQLKQFKNYYLPDPFFCNKTKENSYTPDSISNSPIDHELPQKLQFSFLDPPPVPRMICVYGVNLETEVFFFLKQKKNPQEGLGPYTIDSQGRVDNGAFCCKDGIGYETPYTPQPILDLSANVSGSCSGDGTVPYASLAYSSVWKHLYHLDVEIRELEAAPHREMLEDERFMEILLDYVSGRYVPATDNYRLIQPAFTPSIAYQQPKQQ